MTDARPGLVLVLEGPPERRLPIPAAKTAVLGSSTSRADVVVEAEGVAAAHCAIGTLKKGGFAVRDLGAPGGTRVNGRGVESARLGHGDVLEIGAARLRVVDPHLDDVSGELELESPKPAQAPPAPSPDPAPETGAAERRVGGYRVVRGLGRGATGTVVLAIQESLDREVALKLLSARLARDADFVKRFQDEARAAASLAHANVVTVYDVGEDAGQHFLSMEYMDRGSLETRLGREGPLAWREVVGVLADAARGLEYAEQRGIVHRDIKPANLMQNGAGATKIADLGLAVPVSEDATSGVGTAHFVSPEQAKGAPVDARSDLYSLGATAFRLLTGRTPFEGADKRAILRAVFNDPAPPVDAFRGDVPPPLVALVARLLEKDPDHRPRSARELSFELSRIATYADAAPAAPEPTGGGARRLVLALVVLLVAAVPLVFVVGGLDDDANDTDPTAAERELEDDGPTLEMPEFADVSSQGSDSIAGAAGRPGDTSAAQTTPSDSTPRFENAETPIAPDSSAPGADAALELAEGGAPAGSSESASDLRKRTLTTLRDALALDRPGLRPVEALTFVRDFRPPPELLDDPEFAAGTRSLEEEIVALALGRVERAWLDADAAAEDGDFERTAEILQAALDEIDLERLDETDEAVDPTLPSPSTSTADEELLQNGRVAALQAASDRLAARLAALGDEEDAWLAELRGVEALARSTALAGLDAELAAVDLDGVSARLSGALEKLTLLEERAPIEALLGEVSSARAAIDGLRSAYDADRWRRRSVPDPVRGRGSRGGRTREVVGTSHEGLLVRGDGGAELLPFSAFGSAPNAMSALFTARLDREWTDDERRGVAFLVRAAAVSRALEELRAGLASNPPGLSTDDADDVAELLAPIASWEGGGRDAEALTELTDALVAAGQGAWTAAERGLRRIATDYRDTLVYLLVADGREPAAAPEPEPAPRRRLAAGIGGGTRRSAPEPDEEGDSEDPADER